MISSLERRIDLLVELGRWLEEEAFIPIEVLDQARYHNPWFTLSSIRHALDNIRDRYLDRTALLEWTKDIIVTSPEVKSIGLIMAGNIPLVGFHDFISVFITGHRALIKLSERDRILMTFIFSKLTAYNPAFEDHYIFTERLEAYDAVIATGSDTTANTFKSYFAKVPHVIRGHRNGVAVLYNDTADEQLSLLGKDVFAYFGLGCRNVSKLYLEKGFELNRLFEAWVDWHDIIHHSKYKNNYDYNNALFLLNKEEYYTNDVIILRPSLSLHSRIGTLHYEYFSDLEQLQSMITNKEAEIQCVVSDRALSETQVVSCGAAQSPALTSYADGVDTIAFLSRL